MITEPPIATSTAPTEEDMNTVKKVNTELSVWSKTGLKLNWVYFQRAYKM
jgi:hypothetical protein